MFSGLFGEGLDLSLLFLFIASIFFVFISSATNRESERYLKAKTETLVMNPNIDVIYDMVVKQVEEWRRYPFKPRKLSFASLMLRIPRFAVHKNIPPRLYRVVDRYAGVITFELIPIDDGGTIVKITHSPGAEDLIKAFKVKLPIKQILS